MNGEPRWSPDALYAHFDDRIDDLQSHFDKRLSSISVEIDRRVSGVRDEIETRARNQQTAIDKAEGASRELAQTHNDLIHKGERDAANYASKDELGHVLAAVARLQSFQSKIVGGLIVVAGVGVANFVQAFISN